MRIFAKYGMFIHAYFIFVAPSEVELFWKIVISDVYWFLEVELTIWISV